MMVVFHDGCSSRFPPVTYTQPALPSLPFLAQQDFTILVLLGAGCLSLGLEFAVNKNTGGGEGSWIEGASILAAGARAWLTGCGAQAHSIAGMLRQWNASINVPFLPTQSPPSARVRGGAGDGRQRAAPPLPSLLPPHLGPPLPAPCSVRGGAGHGRQQLPEGAAVPHAAGGVGGCEGVRAASPQLPSGVFARVHVSLPCRCRRRQRASRRAAGLAATVGAHKARLQVYGSKKEPRHPSLTPPQVRAIRDGRERSLPVHEVLVGDVLLVEAGDILCTDGLLVSGSDVKWVHAVEETPPPPETTCLPTSQKGPLLCTSQKGPLLCTSRGQWRLLRRRVVCRVPDVPQRLRGVQLACSSAQHRCARHAAPPPPPPLLPSPPACLAPSRLPACAAGWTSRTSQGKPTTSARTRTPAPPCWVAPKCCRASGACWSRRWGPTRRLVPTPLLFARLLCCIFVGLCNA